MIIKNALVYMVNHQFKKKDIIIKNERISELTDKADMSEVSDRVIDAEGLYAIPGLVDIHFHGAKGYDFCNASCEEFSKIAEYEARNGILTICPATMSYDEVTLSKIIDRTNLYKENKGASLAGIHMEGPFINPDKACAQNPKYIMPADIDMFYRLQERSNGLIKLIDIAPEIPNAIDFIETCGKQVCVSIAHTLCNYETAKSAFEKGAKHVTHLYNAMPGINHREPGPVIAALEAGADVELITDGMHIHPAIVRMTFQMFGADRVILISDSMEATGLSDGTYQLGGQNVTVTGRKAFLSDHPDVLAGSVSNLFYCMKNCLSMGIPFEQAIQAATENPARAIGVTRDYGRITCGNFGNLLLVDEQLQIHSIIKKGTVLL